MKTQTKNTNPGKRNFFQKTMVVMAILVFTGMGFKAKAQTFTIATNNTAPAGCDWLVQVFDNSSIPILPQSFTVTGASGYILRVCKSGVPDHITITQTGCTAITFGSGGSFTYQSVAPPSCSPPSCASSITCAGGAGNSSCAPGTGTGDVHILIEVNL